MEDQSKVYHSYQHHYHHTGAAPYNPPPFKDYLDSKQVEENRVWPIFLFDLACAKSIILANSVGNPQRNGHFKCLFYEKKIEIRIK